MSAGSYFIPLFSPLFVRLDWVAARLVYFIVDSYPFEHNIVEKAGQVLRWLALDWLDQTKK